MSAPWFGDSQLRQSRKNLLLPPLQPLHALGIFQLPVGPAPLHQFADGIGQLGLTEAGKVGDDLAHQIQFAGGEHAPAERNGLFQMLCSPVRAATRSRQSECRASRSKSPAKSTVPALWLKWPISRGLLIPPLSFQPLSRRSGR